MRTIILAAAFASAPALAQDVSIAARGGKSPTAAVAAHCVAYYRTEARLQRKPGAPFEETLRGAAWKSYLEAAARADAAKLISDAEKEISAAATKSPAGDWRKPYEEPCGAFEHVNLPAN